VGIGRGTVGGKRVLVNLRKGTLGKQEQGFWVSLGRAELGAGLVRGTHIIEIFSRSGKRGGKNQK